MPHETLTQQRPNILIIIMDDLAWGDLACHGNPYTYTPNLDRLYQESTHLTRYCSGPLCSPARASLMTGRYHLRTRVIDTYCGRSMLDPEERTLAQALHDHGYRTGAFGKWHLGDCYPMRAVDLGFEETLTHRAGGIGQPGDHPDNYPRWQTDSYFDPVLYHNGEPERYQGYCTDIFTDAAIAFIEEHRDEPFFAYLATNAPHSPLIIGDEWADRYRQMGINETHARLYGMVENIDWNVGRLLNRLDELGLAEDTLVIYTSDHGPCGSARDRTAPPGKQDRFNAGLRGIKGTMYEGGIRVPCFWRWPGHFAADRDVDRISHPIDVFPTLLAACGIPLPTDRAIDGVNLLPLLRGEQEPERWPERTIFMQWHRGDVPVRYRNYAVITQRHKLHRPHESQPDELYDLVADPYEKTDIAADHPELVAELRAQYDNWLDEMAATRGLGTFDPPPIPIGTRHENPVLLTQNDWRIIGEEGWNQDNLRGYWELTARQDGPYEVTVRFRRDVPPGVVHLRVDDREWATRAETGENVCTFPDLHFPSGRVRLEAWRQTDEPCPTALYKRFIPALYVQVKWNAPG
ncbi:MAG: arylsulfatase [Litorilinea sp.]|nr:MAG: arylsulfatase [Litorilinea sp.]